MASPVRTRFAPSPTGLLHVGGVRTALFSWLYARHNGGRFVLRIEDTDETREHPEAIEQIQRSLQWVGLTWDEGPGVGGDHAPYVQSERRARHQEVAATFLAEGRAYRCYCTTEELAAERAEAQREGRPFIYSRRCLALSDEERAAREAAGVPSVIRLRVPDEGECVVHDLVRGDVHFEYAQLGDHVILRSDGVPTYNFANPIDDADMAITHVIRGEDLLSSTPRQVLVHQALGQDRAVVRAPAAALRARSQAPLQAPWRDERRGAARGRLPGRGGRELPRAARLALRLRARAVHALGADRPVLARARQPGARRCSTPRSSSG